jgi:hypothetical protein
MPETTIGSGVPCGYQGVWSCRPGFNLSISVEGSRCLKLAARKPVNQMTNEELTARYRAIEAACCPEAFPTRTSI